MLSVRNGIDQGWIKVNTGPMFSGKTSSIQSDIDFILRSEKARKNFSTKNSLEYTPLTVGIFKHSIDVRYSLDEIVSHAGIKKNAISVDCVSELSRIVREKNYRVIVIDEIQFFDEKDLWGEYKITQLLFEFAFEKRLIICAGLDKDFRGMPFGPMGDILAIADERLTHTTPCVKCGAPASLPQRIVNGKPAHYDDPVKLIGASESYESRCRNCHIVLPPREELQKIVFLNVN